MTTYPADWPRCPVCNDFALDGHITCGRFECNESAARGRRSLIAGAALLLLLSTSAAAAPITGSLSIFGTADLNPQMQTIEFYNGFSLPPITSGSFAQPWTTLNWQNSWHDISWTSLGTNSDLACGTTCLFDMGTAALNVGQLISISYTSDILFVYGTGSMSLAGFDATPGNWSLSSQNGSFGLYDNWTALSWSPAPVPVPVVGSGLSGLAMLLLFLRRRRENCS